MAADLAQLATAPSRSMRPLSLRHHRAPLVEALGRYRAAATVAFSTPGHKGGAEVDPGLHDLLGPGIFGADVWLNTADHATVQAEAEALVADAWGADRSFLLTNGSSAGNHAALLALLSPGDGVVVARDFHTSLLTALVHTGARPTFVAPRVHPTLDVSLGVDPADVAAALAAHPRARLVAVTSPTYWGVAADIGGIAAAAHARGVPVYVDEAWGPHFPYHPWLPGPAIGLGADIAVTSAHKLLCALSQAAILNASSARVDLDRLATAVRMTQTTSPLLPILASLDACRRQMALRGEALLDRALALAADARRWIAGIAGVTALDAERLGLPPERFDRTRLVIDVHGLGLTGFEVERTLRDRFAVAVEMSDLVGIVCLVTVGDSPASIGRLLDGLATIAAEAAEKRLTPLGLPRSAGAIAAPGEQALAPRQAFFARTRAVALAEAASEICAELVVPYPPGIPVLVPGERIDATKLGYLARVAALGAHVRGPADPTLGTLRVVELPELADLLP